MKPLSIGIACYPSVGGSGILATQVGMAMAERGHEVHFVTQSTPHRLASHPRVHVHEVSAKDYHVFQHKPYTLALASRLVDVAQHQGLDVVHAHYAVPHAVAAWLAKDILGDRLRVVTTLHGTDITLVGTDPSYLPITRRAVERSDAVTTPSRWLATITRVGLELPGLPIQVVPNFVDLDRFRPHEGAPVEIPGLPGNDPLLIHVSNLRPLKRAAEVVDIARRVHQQRPVRLLILGDGPDGPEIDRCLAASDVPSLRVANPGDDELPRLVRQAQCFVLPSATESFGLAALEALASGVPVVATHVGGLPEVLGRSDACGRLVGDSPEAEVRVARFAEAVLEVLEGPDLGPAARERAATTFPAGPAIDAYEALYRG